jgi:hypothetical protein
MGGWTKAVQGGELGKKRQTQIFRHELHKLAGIFFNKIQTQA